MKNLTIAISLLIVITGLALAMMPMNYPEFAHLIKVGTVLVVLGTMVLLWTLFGDQLFPNPIKSAGTTYAQLTLSNRFQIEHARCDVMLHYGKTYIGVGDLYYLIDQFNEAAKQGLSLDLSSREIGANQAEQPMNMTFEYALSLIPYPASVKLFGNEIALAFHPECCHFASEIIAMQSADFEKLIGYFKSLADQGLFLRLESHFGTNDQSEVFHGLRW